MTKWCICVHLCTWIIDPGLLANNFISPNALKDLINQYYNSQSKTYGKIIFLLNQDCSLVLYKYKKIVSVGCYCHEKMEKHKT